MTSEWRYDGKGIIKKIYSTPMNTDPIKYRWIVVLQNDLHIRLDDPLINELNLNPDEKIKIEEAKTNSYELLSKIYSTSLNRLFPF
jgi:hypothetical protein